MSRTLRSGELLMPQLLDPTPGAWTIIESVLEQSAVDKTNKVAKVPRALTPSQKLARLHELYHVMISPRDWAGVRNHVLAMGDAKGMTFNSTAVMHIGKMLEENRVDYLLWSEKRVDLRPAREALDWGLMTLPDGEEDLLEAAGVVLQLAWTVWASTGFPGHKVPDAPPKRDCDPDTRSFFMACWSVVQRANPDLARCLVRACLLMYNNPYPDIRDEATAEICEFFQDKQPALPEEKPEEKEEQAEAEAEMMELEELIREIKEGGTDNEVEVRQHVEIHDHTRGLRRPNVRIRKVYSPVPYGTLLKYPQRYYLDKSVFGRRFQASGALMIDMSGSMSWTNDDLVKLLEHMPNMWIAGYAGVNSRSGVVGRICILAKNGRFNEFTGKDPQHNDGNDVDHEALVLLSKQPGPRFWLSDGVVCGGVLHGKPVPYELRREAAAGSAVGALPSYVMDEGAVIHACNQTMKHNQILRVPDKETLHRLVKGQSVTIYRSTFPEDPAKRIWTFGARTICPPEPARFQL